jgi:hypothetical protein
MSHKDGVMPIAKPERREKTTRPLTRTTPLKPKRAKRGRRAGRNREAIYEYACNFEGEPATCWLARLSATPCGGVMTKAHIISKQAIRKEIWNPAQALGDVPESFPATLRELQDDPRCWVPACWAHHSALDIARTLRIAREQLPAAVEAFAVQYGVVWILEREYGAIREAVVV